MKDFKIGDRIFVYATLGGAPVKSKGTIHSIDENRIQVQMDKVVTSKFIWAHHKQCRKIIKRKEIWVQKYSLDGLVDCGQVYCADEDGYEEHVKDNGRWIKFREVKD